MSVTTLNRVENAHQSLYMEKIAALATALGTTADYLLGLSDEHVGKNSHQNEDATPTPHQRTRKAAPVA
jgi:hypothetical protein